MPNQTNARWTKLGIFASLLLPNLIFASEPSEPSQPSRTAIMAQDSERLLKDVAASNLTPQLQQAIKNFVDEVNILASLEESSDSMTPHSDAKGEKYREIRRKISAVGEQLLQIDEKLREENVSSKIINDLFRLDFAATDISVRSIYPKT